MIHAKSKECKLPYMLADIKALDFFNQHLFTEPRLALALALARDQSS